MPYYSGYKRQAPPLPDPSTLPFPGNVIRRCTACDLHKTCQAPVPGKGPIPARILLLGEAPGANEDLWGEPFVGQAGQTLNSLLAQAGVPRELTYVTNCCRCRPPNNAEPKPDYVAACAKWLDVELSLVDPDIVVAMGRPAMARILGPGCGSVEHLHGKPIRVKVGSRERTVLPAYHPAASLHNTALLRQLYDDFQVLRGLAQGVDLSQYVVQDEYPNPDYRVADTPAKKRQLLDEIREVGECAVDVETADQNTRLWSVQVSAHPGTGWFIPISLDFKGRFDTTGWGAKIIVHHYLNDINWLNIRDDGFTDSMVQAYLVGQPQGLKELASRLCGINMISYSEVVRPGQQKLSLAYLTEAAKREWPDPPPIEETKWDNKAGKVATRVKKPWHISRKIAKILADTLGSSEVDPYKRWKDIAEEERRVVEKALGPMPESGLADIPFEDAVVYSVRDADATLRVKHKLDQITSKLQLNLVQHVDLSILPMVDSMMANGMAVNLEHFAKLSKEYTERMEGKASDAAVQVGHAFNPNSTLQVAKVVYGELGFKPTRLTPSQGISTDDQELKKVNHPVAKTIIEYRRLSKLKGTYCDNLLRWSRPDETGMPRIHTTLRTTRVETGRLSSGEPVNLQNIPVRSRDGKNIRAGVVAALLKLLAEGDYSQIEVCTQAHLARCKGLIDLFLRGDDPHTVTASKIFGVPYEEAKKEKYRYPTKRANFGVIYLIGAQGLANQIQEYIADLKMDGEPVEIEPWSVEDCEKFIADWYKLYPEVRDYQLEAVAMARRLGYVKDIIGRIRYIPEVNSPIRSVQEAGARFAANFAVTASAQAIIKMAMGRLWRELPNTEWADKVRFIMQIHDSLIVEVDEDEAAWRPYLSWMRDVMCSVVKLLVPVKVDFKMGKSWSALEKVKL